MRFIRKGGRVIPIRDDKKANIKAAQKIAKKSDNLPPIKGTGKALGGLLSFHVADAGIDHFAYGKRILMKQTVAHAVEARAMKAGGDLAGFAKHKGLAHKSMSAALGAGHLIGAAKVARFAAVGLTAYGVGQQINSLRKRKKAING